MRAVFVGGSSGIGLAAARRAVAGGWDVVVASREPERAADLDAEKVALDVTDTAAVRALFGRLGTVDHLVCSTVARAGGPVRELDLDAARRAFEAKLWGPLAAIQAADVRESVVLVSGVAASTPMRGGAATAAVEALVRTLAVELAPVRANAVSPGIVDTPTWGALPDADRHAMFDRLAGALPAGRVGRAEEIADAIWLLLTNPFVTGTVLHVDGGHRLAAP
jgi:NAD(P)-dependent dehydrogenase (short-subunit alcohol dehydrogenase family)